MVAINTVVRNRREAFVAELTEGALAVMARHSVGGPSVDLEIRLWKRLDQAVGDLSSNPLAVQGGWGYRVAVLTCAAYEVALEKGFTGPFLQLELALWAEFRRVVRNNRFVPGRLAQPTHVSRRDYRLSCLLALG